MKHKVIPIFQTIKFHKHSERYLTNMEFVSFIQAKSRGAVKFHQQDHEQDNL